MKRVTGWVYQRSLWNTEYSIGWAYERSFNVELNYGNSSA